LQWVSCSHHNVRANGECCIAAVDGDCRAISPLTRGSLYAQKREESSARERVQVQAFVGG
jgi:hypothetical protein